VLISTRDPRPLVEATPRIELRTVLRSLDARPAGTVCRWRGGGIRWAALRREDGTDRIVAYFDAGTFEHAEIAFTYGRGWFGPRRVFVCPRCGASVRALYARRRALACRRCHGLAYRSQRMTDYWRTVAARQRINAQLGLEDDGGADAWTWTEPNDKPKGMRWARFGRLWARQQRAAEDVGRAYDDESHAVFGERRRVRFVKRGYVHAAPRLRPVPGPVAPPDTR